MSDGTKHRQKRVRRPDGYSIAKRADGRWESRIVIGYNDSGNPIRKSFYGVSRAAVLELVQDYKSKVDTGRISASSKEMLLGQWLEVWLSQYVLPHREPKTYRYYEAYCRLHIVPALGKVPVRKLTPNQIQKLLNEKLAEGLSAYFIRGLRATLRAALAQAWKTGLIEQNPASRVCTPKVERSETRFLGPSAAKKFLVAAKQNRLGPLFEFTLATGLRIGEVTGLTWDDIDFNTKTVRVRNQLQRIDGKLKLKSLKSESSRREISLGEIGERALQSVKAEQLLNGWAPEEGYIFLNSKGRPLDPKNVEVHLKSVLKSAGLPPMSFHKLRHTAATLMVAGGVELHQVMKQLGHSQISLTANLYAHGVSDAQRRATSVLERVLDSGSLD